MLMDWFHVFHLLMFSRDLSDRALRRPKMRGLQNLPKHLFYSIAQKTASKGISNS